MGIRVAGLDAKRDADAVIGQSGGNGDFSIMDAGHSAHGADGFHSAPDLIPARLVGEAADALANPEPAERSPQEKRKSRPCF